MSSTLKKQADLVYLIIEILWFITIYIVIYFFIGNIFEVMKQGYSIKITNLGLKKFLELNGVVSENGKNRTLSQPQRP